LKLLLDAVNFAQIPFSTFGSLFGHRADRAVLVLQVLVELHTSAGQTSPRKCCKGGLDLAVAADVEDVDLLPHGRSRSPDL